LVSRVQCPSVIRDFKEQTSAIAASDLKQVSIIETR